MVANTTSKAIWSAKTGNDDYSLQVKNLPMAPLPPGQMDLISLESGSWSNWNRVTSVRFRFGATPFVLESVLQTVVGLWSSISSDVGGGGVCHRDELKGARKRGQVYELRLTVQICSWLFSYQVRFDLRRSCRVGPSQFFVAELVRNNFSQMHGVIRGAKSHINTGSPGTPSTPQLSIAALVRSN